VVAGSEKRGGDRRHGERLPAEIEDVADGRWLEGMQQLDVTMMGRRSLMALMPSSSSRSVPNCQSSSVLILAALSPPKIFLQIWIYFSIFFPIPPHL
jgi:hypothetical protein